MRIGYARVSTADQNIDRQQEQLKGLVEEMFCDHASGKDKDRPELERLMSFARKGDEVIICSMDRLSRNLRDLLDVVNSFQEKGVAVLFLKEGFSFKPGETNSVATLTLQIMGAVAEFERQVILERQREGIALAKNRGAYKGRKPLSDDVIQSILDKAKEGIPATRIAKDLGIGVASCYRYLNKNRKQA